MQPLISACLDPCLPAGSLGSRKTNPSEFPILMQLPNLTRIAPRSAFSLAFGLDFGRPCVANRVKLYCTLLNSDET